MTSASSKPTGLRTEYLPTTPCGIESVLNPFSSAIFLRLPFSGSVVAIKFFEGSETALFILSQSIMKEAIVSAVLPDFVMTLIAAFFKACKR